MLIAENYASRTLKSALIAGAAFCFYGLPTHAAEAPGAEASVDGTSVDEVIVTARRRAESLQRVPLSVAAVSGEALEKQGVASEGDLQRTVPGLVVRSTQGSSQFSYAIRGQSIDAFTSSQPAILSYVNEFQTKSITAGSLYDLSSVQVLKGPQGTLFGRNTTGGAVLYSTAPADLDSFEGFAKLQLGRFNQRQGEGAINIPLGGNVALRLAGTFDRRDGFVRNLVSGEDLNDVNRRSVRATLRWRPTERLETVFVGEYGRATGNGDAMLAYSANAPGSIGPDGRPLVSSIASFYGPGLDLLAGPGALAALVASRPFTPAGGYLDAVTQQRQWGNRRTAADADLGTSGKNWYILNTTSYDVSDNLRIKNIAGYSRARNNSKFDQDGSGFPFYADLLINNESDAWSEELQASGNAWNDQVEYIVGGYFSHESRDDAQIYDYFDLGPVANRVLGPAFGGSLPLSGILAGSTKIESIGAFAQATVKLGSILPGLSSTGGFRYTEERIVQTALGGFTRVYPLGTQEREKTGNPSWTIGLEYVVNPDLFLYVAHRGSWRGGGFNYSGPPVAVPADQSGNQFAAEKTKDVEIGAKYQNVVGGMPVRLNVSAYKQWVDNVQRAAYVDIPGFGPSAVTVNAPGANFKGIEADGEISPAEWLRVGGSVSYTNAKYKGQTAYNLFGTNFEFSTFADLPKYAGSLFVEGNFDLENLGLLTVRADGYAQSSMYFSNFGRTGVPGSKIAAYEVVNGRISLSDIGDSRISVAAFVKNAFDEEYYVGGIAIGSLSGFNVVVPGVPRTYGMEVSVQF